MSEIEKFNAYNNAEFNKVHELEERQSLHLKNIRSDDDHRVNTHEEIFIKKRNVNTPMNAFRGEGDDKKINHMISQKGRVYELQHKYMYTDFDHSNTPAAPGSATVPSNGTPPATGGVVASPDRENETVVQTILRLSATFISDSTGFYFIVLLCTGLINIIIMSILVETKHRRVYRWIIDVMFMVFYCITIAIWSVAHHAEIKKSVKINQMRGKDNDYFLLLAISLVCIILMFPWAFVLDAGSRDDSGDNTVPLKTTVIAMNTAYLIHMCYSSFHTINNQRRFFESMCPLDKMMLVCDPKERVVLLYKHNSSVNFTHDLSMISYNMKHLKFLKSYYQMSLIMLGISFAFCAIYVVIIYFRYYTIGVLETNYTTTLMIQYLMKLYQISVWNSSVKRVEESMGVFFSLRVKFGHYEVEEHTYLQLLVFAATYIIKLLTTDDSTR